MRATRFVVFGGVGFGIGGVISHPFLTYLPGLVALLGAAFWDWRTILALADAGSAGFGVGLLAGDLLRASFPIIRGAGETGSIAVAGSVGGASLGAALGYLEKHRPSGEPRAT